MNTATASTTSMIEYNSLMEEEALDIFPEDYSYYIKSFEQLDNQFTGNGKSFVIDARVSGINNDADALKWLSAFEVKTGTQWRVRNTYPKMSRIIWKKGFRCHHNTLPKKDKNSSYKHTDCPCSLILTVSERSGGKWSQKSIPEGYCLNVFYKHCHNHLLKAADALRLLRPSPELTDKFISLFKKNHSPSSALDSHKFDLQMEHGDKYFHAAANGSLCPSSSWCHKLYYRHFKAKYGESMVDDLNKFVDVVCGETTHADSDPLSDESSSVVEHAPPEEAPGSCNVENELSAEDLYEGLLKFAADMKENLEKRGDVYIPAVKDFLKHYQSINSESSLVSALHSFSKSSDPATPRRWSTIPVNSSSIAGRSTYLGGRNTQLTGRPSNDF